MLKDVQHVDIFPRLGNVQVTFGIIIHCFAQHSLYLLHYTPPSSTFIDSLVSFDFSLFQMFGCLLGPMSFDSFEGPLVHKHAYSLIIFNGIKFILTTTITPTISLKNYAFLASIIVVRFIVK
jgi:hypothetical protein